MAEYVEEVERTEEGFRSISFTYGDRPAWWRDDQHVWYARFKGANRPMLRCQDLEAVLTQLRHLHPSTELADLALPLFLHAPIELHAPRPWATAEIAEVGVTLTLAERGWAMRQEITVLANAERRHSAEAERIANHWRHVAEVLLPAAEEFVERRVAAARATATDPARADEEEQLACAAALFGGGDERDPAYDFGLPAPKVRALMGDTGYYSLRAVCRIAIERAKEDQQHRKEVGAKVDRFHKALSSCVKHVTKLALAYEDVEGVTWRDPKEGRVRYAVSNDELRSALTAVGMGEGHEPWDSLGANAATVWRGEELLRHLTVDQLEALYKRLLGI